MLNLDFPRDLLFTAALFGAAAFIWSGWAQERPPRSWVWRAVLGLLSGAGLVLAALTIPTLVREWKAPTAMTAGTGAFVGYLVVFWIEVVGCAALALLAVRAKRNDLIAPLILGIVGLHFFALANLLAQPVLNVAATLLTLVAVVAALVRSDSAASFWCGILGAPVFLTVGVWCAIGGTTALGAN